MASKISRELALLLTGKDISASKSVRGVNQELGKLNAAGAKAGRNVARNLERGVAAGAAVATTAVGFAVKQAMDFESSSASVAKTVDGNIETILRANRELSKTTGLEVNALNEISATAGALGVAKDDVDDFTKTVALLGVTTDDVSTELGATSLGHLSTTLKLADTDFEHLGNTLVFLGNHGASTEGQILSMTENISGAADVMGASTPQVLGWAAALANTGEEAEAGGSSIQRFWLESFKNVKKGGKELALMAKVTGQTQAQFKKAFGKDATGTLAKFITKLGKLSKAEQLATLEALGFTDIRITRALLKLLANTDNLNDSLADSTKGWEENHAATDEAAKRFDTTASKLAILKANVNDAAITIGSELLPVLADLSEDAVGWIDAHQGDIAQFGKDLAAGIKDAVAWAEKLDWEAIGGGLETAADAGKVLIEAFTSAPPWLQGFLTTGFLANKFSGGAVMDIAGILLGQVVRGVLGMTAGVVNINAGVVNGVGGPGGAVPAGKPGGLPGALGVAVPLAGVAASIAPERTPGTGTLEERIFDLNRSIETLTHKPPDEISINGLETNSQMLDRLRTELTVLEGKLTSGGTTPLSSPDRQDAIQETNRQIAALALTEQRQGEMGISQLRELKHVLPQAVATGAGTVRSAVATGASRTATAAEHAASASKAAGAVAASGGLAAAAAIRSKDLSVTVRTSISVRNMLANETFIKQATTHQ